MSKTFTPISALIGGALIGLAAALIWSLLGRIASVSDILGNALTEPGGENSSHVSLRRPSGAASTAPSYRVRSFSARVGACPASAQVPLLWSGVV